MDLRNCASIPGQCMECVSSHEHFPNKLLSRVHTWKRTEWKYECGMRKQSDRLMQTCYRGEANSIWLCEEHLANGRKPSIHCRYFKGNSHSICLCRVFEVSANAKQCTKCTVCSASPRFHMRHLCSDVNLAWWKRMNPEWNFPKINCQIDISEYTIYGKFQKKKNLTKSNLTNEKKMKKTKKKSRKIKNKSWKNEKNCEKSIREMSFYLLSSEECLSGFVRFGKKYIWEMSIRGYAFELLTMNLRLSRQRKR